MSYKLYNVYIYLFYIKLLFSFFIHILVFGNTVKEIDISKAAIVQEKSKFSMWTPEIKDLIQNRFKTKSVILCGLEVNIIYIIYVYF